MQAEYGRILADKAYVDSVLKSGAERAARLANRTVSKVYRKFGLMQLDGNTAQFPPCGLSTAPAAAARHLRCQNAR